MQPRMSGLRKKAILSFQIPICWGRLISCSCLYCFSGLLLNGNKDKGCEINFKRILVLLHHYCDVWHPVVHCLAPCFSGCKIKMLLHKHELFPVISSVVVTVWQGNQLHFLLIGLTALGHHESPSPCMDYGTVALLSQSQHTIHRIYKLLFSHDVGLYISPFAVKCIEGGVITSII